MGKSLFMDLTTVKRKLGNISLEVGRTVYGMDYEFGDTIHGESYYEELEERFYNRIVSKVKRKITEEFPYLEFKL